MSVDQLRFDVAKENLSYVENMISKIQTGNKVLLGDSDKEGFLTEAKLASNDMKTIELEGETRTLSMKDYDDFFNRMRKVVSDEDSYRKELKKNLELRTEEEIEKLEQLRWIQNNVEIGCVEVEFNGIEINTPEDVKEWHKQNSR